MWTEFAAEAPVDRRWQASSRWSRNAEMSRAGFLVLVAGWSSGVAAMLLLSLLTRLAG